LAVLPEEAPPKLDVSSFCYIWKAMEEEFDVFVSYAHQDSLAVQAIVQSLAAVGLRVWRDETELGNFQSITHSLTEGLARCKTLLAYYSRTYPQRRACQWELTSAFISAQREGDVSQRIMIVNPEPEGRHIHPVELRDAKYLRPNSAELPSAVREHVAAVGGSFGDISPIVLPRWFGMAGVGSTRFVGRFGELWQIHSELHASESLPITGRLGPPVVAVSGLGGVGKSLLVEEYALQFGAAFPGGIFWIYGFGTDETEERSQTERDAEREGQIRQFALQLGLAIHDRTPTEIEGILSRELRRINLPCLWIVDDLPTGLGAQAVRRWLGPDSVCKTLITTRSRDYTATARTIHLGALPVDDAYDLLTVRRAPRGEEEEQAARSLVEDLGGHPLAVDVCGAALAVAAGVKSFAQFRNDLAREESDILELAAELSDTLPTGHAASIARTLLYSIENAGAEAQDVLRLASCLATAPIPMRLVGVVMQLVDQLSPQAAEVRLLKALRGLESFCLADIPEGNEAVRSIHTLISRTMRFYDQAVERSAHLREAALALLFELLQPRMQRPDADDLTLEIEHARTIALQGTSLAEGRLSGKIADRDTAHGAYRIAEVFRGRQAFIYWAHLGVRHPESLFALTDLASIRREAGDLNRAYRLGRRVFVICRKAIGPEDPKTINAANVHGGTARALGRLMEARELHEMAFVTSERTLGRDNQVTLQAARQLAWTLWAQGDLPAARRYDEENLEILSRSNGPDAPSTLDAMNSLGATLVSQGEYVRAGALLREAAKGRERILGKEHPDTLTSLGNFGQALLHQRDFIQARSVLQKVVDISIRVLGADHPSAIHAKANLAMALTHLGETEAAVTIGRDVLKLQQQKLGLEHPATLSALNNLAAGLSKSGGLEEALLLHRQERAIAERTLGVDSPHTLASRTNLAVTLANVGELGEALEVQLRVVDDSINILGLQHPQTAGSIKSLAEMFVRISDEDEEQQSGEASLELCRDRLGDNHPVTAQLLLRRAQMIRDSGDLRRSLPLLEKGLALAKRVLGPEHSLTLSGTRDLAMNLMMLGEYPRARQLQESVLAINRERFGEGSVETVDAMSDLSLILYFSGDLANARQLQAKAFDVIRATLGPQHIDATVVAARLAGVMRHQGNFEEARVLLEEVLRQLQADRGDENRLTLVAMSELAETLRHLGCLDEAQALQERALSIQQRVLPQDHPDTLVTMNNLGETLGQKGDVERARRLQEELVELQKRTLGEEHPNTLVAIGNLAGKYRLEGNLSAAKKLLTEVLACHERLFGIYHPHTTVTAYNLFQIHHLQEDRGGAQSIITRDLSWLLTADEANLDMEQRPIREILKTLTVPIRRFPGQERSANAGESRGRSNWRVGSNPRNKPCPCGSGKKYKLCHGRHAQQ
jgi:tetratricopeptide (TPR) repeat protein